MHLHEEHDSFEKLTFPWDILKRKNYSQLFQIAEIVNASNILLKHQIIHRLQFKNKGLELFSFI